MLTIYWFCFAIGGVFVLLAMLGGLDHFDLDHDFDLDRDVDLDVHIDTDIELVDPGSAQPEPRRLSPRRQRWGWFGVFQSLKFWTFGLCFFGLTGLVLSNLSVALPSTIVTIAAVIMGILCGAIVSGTLRALRRQQADSLVRSADLVGLAGTVEVPFNATSRGKVRLQVKGSTFDVVAYTDEAREFQLGESVFVVGAVNGGDQNRLWVVSADSVRSLQERKGENG
jgi:membrane protein implicated in regulation of membrane protease activity